MLTSIDPRVGPKALQIQRLVSAALAVATFAALGWNTQARADSAPLSLEEAVHRALDEAPQVASSAATLEAARSVLPSAGRLPDPEFVAAVDNLPVNTGDSFSLTRDFMTMRRVGLMQSFPNHEKRRLQSERAGQEVVVAQADLRQSRFDTALAVADAWIAQAIAVESRSRLSELKSQTELQAAITRTALANGRATAVEALTAQSLVARLDDRIRVLDQEVESHRAELERWIGVAADRPLTPIPTDLDLQHSPDSLLAAVPQHAPLAPAIAQLDAARIDVALAQADKRPDWSAEINYQKRGSDFSDMVSLEFRVGLPFFSSHRQDPAIAGKLAILRALEADRDAEVRMHTAEVRAAIAAWRGGRDRLDHYKTELLPLARDRTRAAMASYSAGGALRDAIEGLSLEIETELEYVEIEGAVARTWAFLHLLHDSGAAP